MFLTTHFDAWVADLLREQTARAVAEDRPVLDREPEQLGEARFAGAEEARDPDADPLMRLVRGLAVALEDREIVLLDRVGHDVFVDLVAEDLLLDLVDLDDLFDSAADIAREERSDRFVAMDLPSPSSEDFGTVVMLGVEHAHESKPRGTIELAGVEQDRSGSRSYP